MRLSFPSPCYEWRFIVFDQPIKAEAGAAEFGIAINHSHAPFSGFDIDASVALAWI
jgi:hypothetical protein